MTMPASTGTISTEYLELSSSVYEFVSSAAGTAWGSPQHGQILHPRC